MTQVRATGLANVAMRAGADEESRALILTDVDGRHAAFLLNPEAVNALLLPLLGLASEWADRPDLKIEEIASPSTALPANHIVFEPGRHEHEAALRVFLGKMALTFLVPASSVFEAMQAIALATEAASVRGRAN